MSSKQPDLALIASQDLPLLNAFAIFGAGLGQTKLLEILGEFKQTHPDGKRYEVGQVKDGIGHLLARQAIVSNAQGYDIAEPWQALAFEQMHHNGSLRAWVAAVHRRMPPLASWAGLYAMPMLVNRSRCAAIVGDIEALKNHLEYMDNFGISTTLLEQHPLNWFFATPLGETLLAEMDDDAQAMLLTHFLFRANSLLAPADAPYAYAAGLFDSVFREWPELARELCWQAVFRNDQARVPQFIVAIAPEEQPELLVAMLVREGRYDDAVKICSDILAAEKKITRKRKLALLGLLGMFYSLALLGTRNPANYKPLLEQFDMAVRENGGWLYTMHMDWVKHLTSGVPLKNGTSRAKHLGIGLESLVNMLFFYWEEAQTDPQWREALTTMRRRCAAYAWVAHEIDTVLERQFSERNADPDWHAQAGLRPLIDAYPREEAWVHALTALTLMKAPGTTAGPAAQARLAWFVTITRDGDLRMDPREQKRSAKGAWSKGRPVALKRLRDDQSSLPPLTEQDQGIAASIKQTYDGYYGGSDYWIDTSKALPHLIGHPAVFWEEAQDVRIDIVKGDVILQLKEKNGHITLQLVPEIKGNAELLFSKETPTRLKVYPITPDILHIAAILGKGLKVPAHAKPQLVNAISAIAPHIAILSDLPELAAHLDSVAADPMLYAHLLPLDAGLRVQFLVRPLKEGGWFAPGKGLANVVGEQEGRAVQATRELAAEKQRLKLVMDACPMLAEADSDGQDWRLAEPEDCLELLTELKACPPGSVELVWPEGERFRLKATRTLSQMKLGLSRQGDWFVVNGSIELDDGKVLQLRQLLELLAASPGRFLRLGDNDYLALTDSFRRRIEELGALAEVAGKDGLKINHLASGVLAELADEVGELKADKAWREHLAKLQSLNDHNPTPPSTLQASLRDYQRDGFQWLSRLAHWGVGACLADDMGLGKTVQTLALLLERAPRGPALVVAPTSVALNWHGETQKFAPTLNIRIYQENRSLDELGAFDLVLVSYGLLQQDAEAFAKQHWHTVVLDEAQAIKNTATKRSQAAMQLQADFRMIATGTPMENHLGELWNLFRFINPSLLGSKDRFNERFAEPIERNDKAAKQALKKLIRPFMLRRTKTQVLEELPPRTEITLRVPLSHDEMHLYEALRQQAVERLDELSAEEGKKPLQVLAEITKLRRFCCHPKLVLKDSALSGSKLAAFAEVVTELLENRHKALVFSQFVDHLSIVRDWLDKQGIRYQYLDGSTLPKQRQAAVNAFQAGEGEIFLISLKAGGSGLNLTAADYVIHLDPWWNPAVEDQASDRAHRIGQQRPVTIYRLVAENTIEEQIIALHHNKRDLADSLLEGGDASGKVSTDELLKLLKGSGLERVA